MEAVVLADRRANGVYGAGQKHGLRRHGPGSAEEQHHEVHAVGADVHQRAVAEARVKGVFDYAVFKLVIAGGILTVAEPGAAHWAYSRYLLPQQGDGWQEGRAHGLEQHQAPLLRRGEHGLQLHGTAGDGLFTQDMLAPAQHQQGLLAVQGVGAGDVNSVHALRRGQRLQAVGPVRRAPLFREGARLFGTAGVHRVERELRAELGGREHFLCTYDPRLPVEGVHRDLLAVKDGNGAFKIHPPGRREGDIRVIPGRLRRNSGPAGENIGKTVVLPVIQPLAPGGSAAHALGLPPEAEDEVKVVYMQVEWYVPALLAAEEPAALGPSRAG